MGCLFYVTHYVLSAVCLRNALAFQPSYHAPLYILPWMTMILHVVFRSCLDHLEKAKEEFNIVRTKLGKMLEVVATTMR